MEVKIMAAWRKQFIFIMERRSLTRRKGSRSRTVLTGINPLGVSGHLVRRPHLDGATGVRAKN